MEEIKVMIVKPMRHPEMMTVGNTHEAITELIGTYDAIFPPNDPVVIICDDMGQINGSIPNRVYAHEIIAGDFIVAGVDDEGELIDLPDEMIEKYRGMFDQPLMFVPMNDGSVLPLMMI